MSLFSRSIACGLLLMAVTQSQGATFNILGRSLTLIPPSGFCELGQSGVERRIFEAEKQASAGGGMLVQLAVPCGELKALRDGMLRGFSQSAKVLVLKTKGELTPIDVDRDSFIKAVGANLDRLPDRTDSRIQKIGQLAATTKVSGLRPVGWDTDAVYVVGISEAEAGGVRYTSTMSGAMTVVNRLLIGVYGSSTEPTDQVEKSHELMTRYLRATLLNN